MITEIYPVKFVHLRDYDFDGCVDNRGGATVAYIETAEGWQYAAAVCSPNDNFSKQFGRAKAAGRLNSPQYVRRVVADSRKDFLQMMEARYTEGLLI